MGQASCIVQELGSGYGQQGAHAACLPARPGPAWPGPQTVSKSTQVTELKQCETLGLHYVAKNAFSCGKK